MSKKPKVALISFKTASLVMAPLSPEATGEEMDLDPAQQVLLDLEEDKKRRKREETRIQLSKIHDRIKHTLMEYERWPKEDEVEKKGKEVVDFASVEDPLELFDLLSDPNMRSKYQQYVTVFIIGYEEKCEDREKLLQSLQDFFQETQAGNTEQVLEEVAAGEVDFDEATAGLESALETAQAAADRLLKIKHEMGQLFAIFATYPDTKKGRKKMEKALLKAQEEVEGLNASLQSVQQELEQSKDKCKQLQKQAESKTAENAKLRKTTDQVKKLETTNDSLKAELSIAQSTLKKAQEDLEKAKNVKTEVKEVVKVDEGKTRELEAQVAAEREGRERVEREKEEVKGQLRGELDRVREEHEREIEEMRSRYEEQLRSLMVDEGEEEGGEEQVMVSLDTPGDELLAGDEEPPPTEGASTEELDGEGGVVEDGATTLASGSFVQRMKQDHETTVKKLNKDLSELKDKSRKTITSLRARLADTQNQHTAETNTLRAQMSSQEEQLQALAGRNSSLSEQVAELEEVGARVRAELEDSVSRREELQVTVDQLRNELRTASTIPSDQPISFLNQSSHMAKSLGNSPPQAMPPLIPMEEVLHDDTLSMATPLHLSPQYGSQLFMDSMGGGVRMTSLEGSLVSLDSAPFGSPLQQKPMSTLPLLAQSRLSFQQQHSPSPQQAALTFTHPVVTEWTKAYDAVMKFRDGLVDLLSESDQWAGMADELRSVEVHTLDKSQDVQGQVTQMRFSLSLLLHQMEQTLQETLYGGEEGREGERGGEDGPPPAEGNELTDALVQIKKKLKHSEEKHKIELEESKEMIANLSSKVESLKIEVAGLRFSLPVGEGSIMFTRLDTERNTRTLKQALEDEKISPTMYSKLTANMNRYVSIPGRRLVRLSRRFQDRAVAKRLMEQVQRNYQDPEVASKLVEDISNLDLKRQLAFSEEMERLGALRTELAHSLTDTFKHVERVAGVFLIKPIYAPRGSRTQGALITPISRPLPVQKPLVSLPVLSRRHTGMGSVGGQSARSTPGPHPKMKLVSSLLLHSRQGHKEDTRESIGSANISGRGTPHPQRLGDPSLGEWSVTASRTPALGDPISPPPPTLPRMLELEVSRDRQPSSLLAHLLPSLRLPHAHSPPTHRLAPLMEHSQDNITSEIPKREQEPPAATNMPTIVAQHPLPSIRVPSRADGPIAVP